MGYVHIYGGDSYQVKVFEYVILYVLGRQINYKSVVQPLPR